MTATGPVDREFREINRRTEISTRWSDECVELVMTPLAEVQLNRMRLEC